ncbi:MAG TPA: PKD domain-containing protein [Flavisolibacter sp.]|nr:PKD domain-containing protein [Flavisolibacter sp.]
MERKSHILLFLCCLVFFSSWGQQFENIQFIENKGQWENKVRFKGSFPGGAIFIQRDGFTVLQHNPDDYKRLAERMRGHQLDPHARQATPDDSLVIRSHAYEAQFVGANTHTNIIADKPIVTYSNYFIGSDPSKWAVGCKTYQGITIENLYPNVDLRYYSNNGLMKYDLIVKPGGNVSQIALQYKGVEKLTVKNKELIVGTSVGQVRELYPYTYQYNAKGKQEVPCKYVVQGNTVRFEVKNYDPTVPLVIDPTLIFSSFSGSAANNWGFTATYGPDGSLYGGGIVEGSGFPVSPGAVQTNYGGDSWDIGIIKLTPDGTNRVYATYLGGEKIEQPHSLVVDGQGNLIIAGRSNSDNYPTTGINKVGPGGNYDIIVTKLNATGTAIIGSLKIGGSNDDGVNISPNRNRNSLQYNYGDDGRSEVILDGANNIYVASSTQSISTSAATQFPIIGGFQSVPGTGGTQDGVVMKLTPNVSNVLFSSFLGGNGNDAAYVLAINPTTNNIYVAGGTESTNLANTSGAIYPANQSATQNSKIDGFVSIISNNGSSLIRTTYLGTTGVDQVYGIQFDKLGFPYVMGQTTGTWPVQAPWSQPGGKQFIAKLQPDLSAFVYSTVFGSGSSLPNISPVAFLVDRCENVYVSGWGGTIPGTGFSLAGTAGLTTVNPLQPTTDGEDFYFFVLKRNATDQLYGDFFGQRGGMFTDHVDGGTSRFDANGIIYMAMCANCGGGARFPTTPNAWATTNGALNGQNVNCNLAMVKIDLDLAGIRSGVQASINGVPRDTAGCIPLTVDFRDTVLNAVSYEWDFDGDGNNDLSTTTPNASYTYPAVGSYRVRLIAIDPNSCNLRDTSFVTIKAGDVQASLDFTQVKLEPCEQFNYRFTNTSIAPGSTPFSDTSFIWDFGDGTPQVRAGLGSVLHQYATPGSYRVRLYLADPAYCNAPDSLVRTLNVAALVKARFETPPAGCAPYTAVFTNTSDGGQDFFWDFGDGTTSTEPSPTHQYLSPGTYTIRLRVVDPNTCNREDQTSFTITVFSNPVADFSVSPQPPIVNTPINFTNLASSDGVRFKWLFGDGDSLITTTRVAVQHEYNSTGRFDACLIVFNANNCSDTICKPVEALVEPAVDVPNAFTPLSGDVNSKIFVRGYGIQQIKFIIWNRWGQKVFETDSHRVGWDGRFKGTLQPMDVYAYTLEVNFTDGTKASKRGDITLIR